jgi:serine/threonine protein kinase
MSEAVGLVQCGVMQVGDFGLARFLEGPEHSHISNARQGTPFYIAPEVGLQRLGIKGDCWQAAHGRRQAGRLGQR